MVDGEQRTGLMRALTGRGSTLLLGMLLGALAAVLWPREGTMGPAEDLTHPAPSADRPEPIVWTCSMHPQIRRLEPGACPICGMDLIVAGRSDAAGEQGMDEVFLSPRAQKLTELRTTVVHRQSADGAQVRLLGRLEPNEKTLRVVTAWTGGRVDRLYVNTTGEKVVGGQTVATLYSPEIFAAHQDLIVAKNQVHRMSQATESAQAAAKAALDAARRRLSLLGVPDGELSRMETKDQPTTSVSIRTPFGGTVLERFVTEGSYVQTGARLYSIAQLGTLWVQLDAYESDLALLEVGQKVQVEVEAFPGEPFEGTITFIEPTLDERRRTSSVRVEIDNPDGRLRPGMFAEATAFLREPNDGAESAGTTGGSPGTGARAAPLVIPASAPLFTGKRAVVYVEEKSARGAKYRATTVRLGPRRGNVYPVVAGLQEGQRIVTRGAFAIDADLQIRGGTSMMNASDDRQPVHSGESFELPRSELHKLGAIVADYLVVQAALASDDLAKGQAAAGELGAAAERIRLENDDEAEKRWEHFSQMFRAQATQIEQANSIERARKGFEGLSGTMVMMLRVFGNPLDQPLRQAHCPMARGSEGASWVQLGEDVQNSYFGSEMLSCGDITRVVPPGEHLSAPEVPQTTPPPMEGHRH